MAAAWLVGVTGATWLAAGAGAEEPPIPFVVPASHVEAPGADLLANPVAPGTPSADELPLGDEEVFFISPAERAVAHGEQLFNPLGGPPAEVSAAVPSFVVPTHRHVETPVGAPVAAPVRLAPTAPAAAPIALANPVGVAAPVYAVADASPGVLDVEDLTAAVNPASILQPAEEVAPPPGEPTEMNRRQYRPITDLTVNVALPTGLSPGQPGSEIKEPSAAPTPEFGDARLVGGWPMTDFQWAATAMRHKPLYFEEVNLERYGYTVSPVLQPIISGAHFFATIPALPYKMTTHPPCECYYTLGYYRAGNCGVPRRWHHEPIDPLAAAVEAGFVVGLVYIIP